MNKQNVKEQTLLTLEGEIASSWLSGEEPTADDHLLLDTIQKFGLAEIITQ